MLPVPVDLRYAKDLYDAPNLQDPGNKQLFTVDKKMGKVFGADRMRAFGMSKLLDAQLKDL